MMPGVQTPEQMVAALAERIGVPMAAGTGARLVQLATLMLRWNEHINLTGAREPRALIEEQFGDAFALARLTGGAQTVVDVGSGGGLPGLVFGLLRPEVALTLTEPRAKRRAFLHTATREVGIEASVLADRVEAMAPGVFDLACARAVFPPAEWLTAGSRIVHAEGRVVLFLSEPADWTPPADVVLEVVSYAAGRSARRAVAVRPIVPAGATPT